VIQAIVEFYSKQNTNVHRSSYSLAAKTTTMFEQARAYVKDFIHAQHTNEIIFTKGTTEGINLITHALADVDLPKGGRILVSATEHHANLVPWQQLAKKKSLHLDVIPINDKGIWQVQKGLSLLTEQTCIVALGLVSNALGTIQPVEPFIQKAKKKGALTLLDAAQAVAHVDIDVQQLDCDFLVFSAHKAYGPTGVGVLYGKSSKLEWLPVFLTGGEMIEKVDYHQASFQSSPFKFEAGTPNVEGVLAMHQGLRFIKTNKTAINTQESRLLSYLHKALKQIDGINIYGDPSHSIATVSFTINGCDSHDLGVLLNEQGIAVRVGHHCAMPLMKSLAVTGTLRISLACYNHQQEIDTCMAALKLAIKKLRDDNPIEQSLRNHSRHQQATTLPLAQAIKNVQGWDSVYRQIMLAGKAVSGFPSCLKTPEHEVFGCESQVWLVCHQNQAQEVWFEFDATGKIVRGLLAILLEPVQSQSIEFARQFDFLAHLKELRLDKHISASRGNGLASVIKKIKQHLQH
jgi:cysteine desulfurase/selenocysteine lyase